MEETTFYKFFLIAMIGLAVLAACLMVFAIEGQKKADRESQKLAEQVEAETEEQDTRAANDSFMPSYEEILAQKAELMAQTMDATESTEATELAESTEATEAMEEPEVVPEPVEYVAAADPDPVPTPEPAPVIQEYPPLFQDHNPADDGILTVCLDPGHGGKDPGADNAAGGRDEKDINLTIALYVRDILQANGINVIMTRDGDTTFDSRRERVDFAYLNGADYMISLHNNSSTSSSARGCMAICTQSYYIAPGSLSSDVYGESHALAGSILSELNAIGIDISNVGTLSNGIMHRLCTDGKYYDDGSKQDYYGIINRSMEYGIPATIIEHNFMSNYDVCCSWYASDEMLYAMAEADARGILNYLAGR